MIRVIHPGSGSRIRILIFYPSRMPDPGVKKAPDPGSATLVPGAEVQLPVSQGTAIHRGWGNGS